MVQPIDQGSILASGRALVPDYAAQMVQQALLGVRRQEAQTNAIQAGTQASAEQREAGQEQAFQAAIGQLGERPTAAQLAELAIRFPRFSEGIRRGWEMQEEGQRTADFRQIAEVHDAARGGRYDLAARTMRARIEADPTPDPTDQAILEALESGDPAQQRTALDLLERTVSAIAGPTHYASIYGTFSRRTKEVDGIVYDEDTGEALFQSPYPRVVSGEGGIYVQPRVSSIPVLGGAEATGSEVRQPPAAAPSSQPAATGWNVISRPGAPRDGGARVHQGFDITPPDGQPEWRPSQPFTIANPRTGDRQGNTADVILEDGTRIVAMHLRELPRPGRYNAGDVAVIAGNTGNARNTPTHIHAEAHRNGQRIDPSPYFGAGGAVTVRSVQQANALPRGTRYRTPEGREFIR